MAGKKQKGIEVPEGWILVPKNPTPEMLQAGDETFVPGYNGTPISTPGKVWGAMVKSAPKPPATQRTCQNCSCIHTKPACDDDQVVGPLIREAYSDPASK